MKKIIKSGSLEDLIKEAKNQGDKVVNLTMRRSFPLYQLEADTKNFKMILINEKNVDGTEAGSFWTSFVQLLKAAHVIEGPSLQVRISGFGFEKAIETAIHQRELIIT